MKNDKAKVYNRNFTFLQYKRSNKLFFQTIKKNKWFFYHFFVFQKMRNILII